MELYCGFVSLGSTFKTEVITRDTSKVPKNASTLPTYRIYGPGGLMANGAGTAALRDTGTITGATNASPIVVTSTNHGLNTGTRGSISGVGGNTAANGDFSITKVNDNSFSLDGSTGNGAYTSGGTWNVAGLYLLSQAITIANSYLSGTTYSIVVTFTVSAVQMADLYRFTVV